MMELPQGLIDGGDWPIATEIELLKRVQAMHSQLNEKIRNMTQELKTNQLYPRKTDSKELRIRLYHTFTPPVPSESEETPATPGRWTLRTEAADTKMGVPSVVNFSTYFRKATIELDPRIYADSIIEWTSFQKAHHDVDGLEVTRSGHVPHTVRIKLLPAQTPERFSISEQLKNAIGEFLSPAKAFTKQNIVMATWEYIKHRDLIKEDDCRVIVCDATLAQVFDCEQLAFSSVVVALKPHLTPVNSIDLEYTLSLSGSSSEDQVLDEKFFDVDVGAVDPLEKARERVLLEWEELNQEQQKDLNLLKQQESDIVERLHEHCRKREWMHQFASDPVGFVKDVALSQQADQQILVAEAETDEINVPHPQQFSQPWVREVVSNLLTTPATTH